MAEAYGTSRGPGFQCSYFPAQIFGDSDWCLGVIVEQNDYRIAVSGDSLEMLAENGLGERQAGVADFGYAGANVDGVRKADWPAKVAVDRGKNGARSCVGQSMAQAKPLEVRNAARFKPTEINCVIHVAESVLVAPLHRPGKNDGKVDEWKW